MKEVNAGKLKEESDAHNETAEQFLVVQMWEGERITSWDQGSFHGGRGTKEVVFQLGLEGWVGIG